MGIFNSTYLIKNIVIQEPLMFNCCFLLVKSVCLKLHLFPYVLDTSPLPSSLSHKLDDKGHLFDVKYSNADSRYLL